MADLNLEKNRLLDVIDEADTIIDSKPREEVHQFGLLHREVHVWMFNKDFIFFQQRGISVYDAGLLDATIAGHVNKGEDYLEAALRETEEETSISLSPQDLILLKKYRNTASHEKEGSGEVVNNSIRYIYLYKQPIEERHLKEEEGILGVSFKKFSISFLQHMNKKEAKIFRTSIINEIPGVLKYISSQEYS